MTAHNKLFAIVAIVVACFLGTSLFAESNRGTFDLSIDAGPDETEETAAADTAGTSESDGTTATEKTATTEKTTTTDKSTARDATGTSTPVTFKTDLNLYKNELLLLPELVPGRSQKYDIGLQYTRLINFNKYFSLGFFARFNGMGIIYAFNNLPDDMVESIFGHIFDFANSWAGDTLTTFVLNCLLVFTPYIVGIVVGSIIVAVIGGSVLFAEGAELRFYPYRNEHFATYLSFGLENDPYRKAVDYKAGVSHDTIYFYPVLPVRVQVEGNWDKFKVAAWGKLGLEPMHDSSIDGMNSSDYLIHNCLSVGASIGLSF